MSDQLDALFDDPSTRSLPLTARNLVTDHLETTLKRIIDLVQPDLFVEIGAFEAAFSIQMRKRFPASPVIAFEANPRVAALHGDKARAAGVDYREAAVADADGSVTFNIVEVVAGKDMPFENRMGSLHDLGLRDSRTTPVTVKAQRLDSALQDTAAQRACLWIDVEGAATAVVRGAPVTLARTAIVYCEVESSQVWKEQDLDDVLMRNLAEAGFVLVARDCQKWFQKNCLFLRETLAGDPAVGTLVDAFRADAATTFSAAVKAFQQSGLV